MTETKHTPGPYMVASLDSGNGGETLCIATEGGGVIAVMGGAPRRWIEDDATLLAAAPDLLKALEEALFWNGIDYRGTPAVWAGQARAAIAKALPAQEGN